MIDRIKGTGWTFHSITSQEKLSKARTILPQKSGTPAKIEFSVIYLLTDYCTRLLVNILPASNPKLSNRFSMQSNLFFCGAAAEKSVTDGERMIEILGCNCLQWMNGAQQHEIQSGKRTSYPHKTKCSGSSVWVNKNNEEIDIAVTSEPGWCWRVTTVLWSIHKGWSVERREATVLMWVAYLSKPACALHVFNIDHTEILQ